MDSSTGGLSRADIHAAVVSALLSTRADHDHPALVDDETAIGGDGLGISSLNLLQSLVRIEDTVGVAFDDRAVAEAPLASVGAIVDLVERMLAAEGK